MGWIKDAKANALTTEAQRAIEEGRTVFTPRLNTPATAASLSGSVSGWAEMIEAIEESGWTLAHWTATDDSKRRPVAYPLFRRR
jgi:hypothetical protein